MEIRNDWEECGLMIDSAALVQGFRRLEVRGVREVGAGSQLWDAGRRTGNCRRTILRARWRRLIRDGSRVAVVS